MSESAYEEEDVIFLIAPPPPPPPPLYTAHVSFRLLEVNGHDVAHATPEGVKSILQNTFSSIQLVVARQQVEPERREEIGGSAVPGQMQESRDSLQEELKAERTEAQKWKELYEQ